MYSREKKNHLVMCSHPIAWGLDCKPPPTLVISGTFYGTLCISDPYYAVYVLIWVIYRIGGWWHSKITKFRIKKKFCFMIFFKKYLAILTAQIYLFNNNNNNIFSVILKYINIFILVFSFNFNWNKNIDE